VKRDRVRTKEMRALRIIVTHSEKNVIGTLITVPQKSATFFKRVVNKRVGDRRIAKCGKDQRRGKILRPDPI
jgi:hypothetical protein